MRLVAPLAFALALAASSVEAGVLDRIKETGTIRFGYREDAAPLSYLDEEKKPAGYSVLICDAVAASLGSSSGSRLKADWQPVTAENRFDAVAEGKDRPPLRGGDDHAHPAGAGGLLAADLRRRRGGDAAAGRRARVRRAGGQEDRRACRDDAPRRSSATP